jgi:hypothetical protein
MDAPRRTRPKPAPGIVPRPRKVIDEWRAGRRVGFRGTIAFWFVHAGVRYDARGVPQQFWRQHRLLDEKERAFYDSIHPHVKEEIGVVFPPRPVAP